MVWFTWARVRTNCHKWSVHGPMAGRQFMSELTVRGLPSCQQLMDMAETLSVKDLR